MLDYSLLRIFFPLSAMWGSFIFLMYFLIVHLFFIFIFYFLPQTCTIFPVCTAECFIYLMQALTVYLLFKYLVIPTVQLLLTAKSLFPTSK